MLKLVRQIVNFPHSPRHLLTIAGTLVLLFAVPITVFSVLSSKELKPRAKENTPAETLIKKQTIELANLARRTNKEASAAIKFKLLSLAKQRKQTLLSLIDQDPGLVSRIAFSEDLKKTFPPEILKELESVQTLEGTLEVAKSDDLNFKVSHYYYFLKSVQKEYSVFFDGKRDDLISGLKVRLKGVVVGDKIAVSSSKTDLTVLSSSVLPSTSTKKVAVILFNFQDNSSQPYDQNLARQVTFTNTTSANSYYKESSFDLLKLEGSSQIDGDVYGWYTIPYSSTTCDWSAWGTAARQAAIDAGVNLNNYTNIIHAFPSTSACYWWGLGYLPGRYSWVNGSYQTKVVAHELGHNFGAHHSSSWGCVDSNGQRVTISNNCSTNQNGGHEYGDPFDVMGRSARQMNNFQKGRLGWYDQSNTQTVTASGTYTLEAVENFGIGVKSLRVPRTYNADSTVRDFYYIEFRKASGNFDNFSSNDPILNGISIRVAPNYSVVTQPLLLDNTPATTTYSDSPLAFGQTFNDTTNNIMIKAVSKNSDTATVEITIGSISCVRANPSLSISPTSQWGQAGQELSYQLTITNNDGLNCSAANFSIIPKLPSGFIQSPASFNETLQPGASVTRSFTLTAPLGVSDGFYTFWETATNTESTAYMAEAAANYNVSTPDNQPPTVGLTNPLDGATVSGNVSIVAEASDNVAVQRVEFWVDSEFLSYDQTPPYNALWDSTKVSNGLHNIQAKVFDTSSNLSSDSITVNVQNGDTVPPTAPTGVTANSVNSTMVRISWNPSSDNVGVVGYQVFRNLIFIASVSSTSFDDIVSCGLQYSYHISAYDAAGNYSTLSNPATITPACPPDTTPPTAPGNLSAVAVSTNQINLSWSASTDNVGVVGYEIYREGLKIAFVDTTSFGDTGLNPSTTYSYFVRAKDAAGNLSENSNVASATTKDIIKSTGNITGTVKSLDNSVISNAKITLFVAGNKRTYYSNSQGLYLITGLPVGSYDLKFQAKGYISQTVRVSVVAGITINQDVTLQKR